MAVLSHLIKIISSQVVLLALVVVLSSRKGVEEWTSIYVGNVCSKGHAGSHTRMSFIN